MTRSTGYVRTVSADDSGFVYETKMSALVAMRLFNSYDEFHVASNLSKAGKFDDIVFSARKGQNWNTYFVQLKHKHVKKKISKISLYQGAKGKDDYNILKYFDSYIEMQKMFKPGKDVIFGKPLASAKFILFTNGLLHDELLSLKHQNVDIGLLSTKPGAELNFQVGAETDFDLLVKLIATRFDLVRPFINQFYFCSGQVDESGIDKLVCEEIRKSTGLSPNEVKNILGQLYDHVRRKHREGQYLTKEDINTLITKANFYAQSGKKSVASVTFAPSFLQEFEKNLVSGTPVLLTCAADKTLMCMAALKQLNLLDEPNHEFALRSLEGDDFNPLLGIWKQKDKRALVIDCDIDAFTINQEVIVQRLRQLCTTNPNNRIILVAGKENTVAKKLASELSANKQRFNCTLKTLANESKNLLQECKLKFQGYETPLSSLTCGSKLLDDVFDMASMTSLLVGGQIDVGTKPVEHITYYVPRVLNRNKTVDLDVFLNPPPGNVFVVSGITNDEAVASLPFESGEIGTSSFILLSSPDMPACKVYVLEGLDPTLEFEKFLKMKSNVHWLEHSQKHKTGWFWRRSTGNIDLILNNVTGTFEYITTDNIMKIEDKVVVVAAEPGMGKSTLLDHLAAQTKTSCPHMWVISVQLNDCADHLSNKNFLKNIKTSVKTLIASAAGVDSTTSKFNARLFNHCYDVTGNMIVLLDGFDEITPTYTREGIELIKTLQESLISRVWVTTRPVWASLLQSTTSTLSFSIQPLGVKEQTSFLQKFWGQNAKDDNSEDLEIFIKKVLKLIRESIDKDLNEFTGIPLQTRMVAEAFNPKQELPERINGLQLFEKFVETKIDISFRDKLKIASTNARMLSEVKCMKERLEEKLMQLGLLTLLSLEDCSKMEPPITREKYKELRKYVEDGEENAGLVVSFASESPQFIHRTFAEYFVAKFLADRFNANRKFLVSETFFSPLFSFVQYFFNRILAKDKKFHEAVLQRNLSLDSEYIREKINSRDEGGRTPLHLAASLPDGKKIIKILLEAGAGANMADAVLDWKPLDYAIQMRVTENIGPLLEVSKPSAEVGNIVPITWESLRLAISGDYLQLLLYLFDKNIAATVGMHVLQSGQWLDDLFCVKLTLLHVAAWYNATKILGYLLSPDNRDCKLSQLECLDGKGRTPLLLAGANNSLEAVRLLLDANASMFAKTEEDKDIAELALDLRNSNMLKLALATMESRGLPPEKILKGAVSVLIGDKSTAGLLNLEALLSHYPQLKHITTKREVPLITAASIRGNENVVALLIKEVDVNVVHKGSTPLHFAVRGGHFGVVQLLLQSPSLRKNVKDFDGNTPYSLAASIGEPTIAELLKTQIMPEGKENVFEQSHSSLLQTSSNPQTEPVTAIVQEKRQRKKTPVTGQVEGKAPGDIKTNPPQQLPKKKKKTPNLAQNKQKQKPDTDALLKMLKELTIKSETADAFAVEVNALIERESSKKTQNEPKQKKSKPKGPAPGQTQKKTKEKKPANSQGQVPGVAKTPNTAPVANPQKQAKKNKSTTNGAVAPVSPLPIATGKQQKQNSQPNQPHQQTKQIEASAKNSGPPEGGKKPKPKKKKSVPARSEDDSFVFVTKEGLK